MEDIYKIRKELAEVVGALENGNEEEVEKYIRLTASDVTGSLGVWGIAH